MTRGPHPADLPLTGAVYGVGSLPHTDPLEAVALIGRACRDLPFWPQLPARAAEEGMIAGALADVQDLLEPTAPWTWEVRDRAAFLRRVVRPQPADGHTASGLAALEARGFEDLAPTARAIKGQVTGPLTLASSLRLGGQPALDDDALLRALAVRVTWQASDQVVRLRASGRAVVLVVDEPILGLLPAARLAPDGAAEEALLWSLSAVHAAGAGVGLHCCSAPPWATLARLPLDLVSFDATAHLDAMMASADGRALAASRWVAWGLIPATADPRGLDPDALFAAWLAALPPELSPAALARRALVSASCGLAGLPVARVGPSFQLCEALGARMRQLAWTDTGAVPAG